MRFTRPGSLVALVLALAVALAGCAPAAPASPTAAPAKSAPTAAAKAQPTSAPAKAAAPSAPAQPAAKAAEKAAPKTEAKPAAKASFDQAAVASFYTGKTVKIIVGASPGGGYDTYARAIGRHLGKHIPGNPTVIVENMPGAGSMVAANHAYNVAEKDGTVILHPLGGVIGQQFLGNKSVEFDAKKFNYLGAPVADTAVLHVHQRTGVKSLKDIIGPNTKELVVGGNAPGSMNVDAPIIVRDVLGANIKVVQGYTGSALVRNAIEAGELDGFFNAWESTKITSLDKVQSGEWVNIFQQVMTPHREMPDVPTIPDVTDDKEKQQLLFYGYTVPGQYARPFMLPPDVPADRVAAMQSAFMNTLEDKEFLADAEKGKLTLDPMDGATLQKLIQDYLDMPAELKGKLQQLLATNA